MTRTNPRISKLVAPLIFAVLVLQGAAVGGGAAPQDRMCGTNVLDVMLLLDASGSMGGEIDDLKTGFTQLVTELQGLGFDVAFGLVVFGWWPGGQNPINTDGSLNSNVVSPLSTDTGPMQTMLNGLTANGGWEPWGDAVYILNHHTPWRAGAQRIGVIATDEPVDEGRRVPGPLTRTNGNDYDGQVFYDELNQAAVNEIALAAIDSGGGLTTTQLQAAATITGGAYTQLAHGTAGFVEAVKDMILASVSAPYRFAEGAGYIQHVNAPSNPVVTIAATAAGGPDAPLPSREQETFAEQYLPAIGALGAGSAEVLMSESTVAGDEDHAQARAVADLEKVSLLDDFIVADAIHVVADAARDIGASPTANRAGSYITNLRIGTMVFPEVTSPMTIPVPGVGTVYLLQVSTQTNDDHAAILVRGIHVDIDTPTERATVIVGEAAAHAGCTPAPARLTHWYDNDAGTGTDIGSDETDAHSVTLPTLLAGRLGADGDRADAYSFSLAGPGEAISVTLKPSERVQLDFGPTYSESLPAPPAPPTPPATPPAPEVQADLSGLRATLIDPNGQVQEDRTTILTAPLNFEFNPHIAGIWTVIVSTSGNAITNYTLGLVAYDLPVFEQDGTLSDSDTSGVCGAGPLVAHGVYTGALYDSDYEDSVRFEVEMGDIVSAVLKPSENTDGARFQLFVYDDLCVLRASGVWNSLLPEGTPRAAPVLSAERDGEWTARIVRQTDAVGNYYLSLSTVNPMPPLLGPDAGTNSDAGSSFGSGIAITPGAHQGRFEEGDNLDCYTFTAGADERVVLTATPSAGMELSMTYYGTGATVTSNQPLSVPEYTSSVSPGGSEAVCIQRLSGGGQYMLSLALLPEP